MPIPRNKAYSNYNNAIAYCARGTKDSSSVGVRHGLGQYATNTKQKGS